MSPERFDQWVVVGLALLAVATSLLALAAVIYLVQRTQSYTLGVMDRFHAKNYNEFMMSQLVQHGDGRKIPGVDQPEDKVSRMDKEALDLALEVAQREATGEESG